MRIGGVQRIGDRMREMETEISRRVNESKANEGGLLAWE